MAKYSKIERERKFLISPESVNVTGLDYKRITDFYVLNTSLRFRVMAGGRETTYKLTQKMATVVAGEAQITTIYLNQAEFNLFNIVETVKVEKVRYLLTFNEHTIGLDYYVNAEEELWIAEVEFLSTEDMSQFEMPIPFLMEITHQTGYNGFELAMRFQV